MIDRVAPRAISSLQNETVKLIRSLDMRKARRETGLFVAEGASVLLTARDCGWAPRMLVSGPDAPASTAFAALRAWAAASAADHLDVTAAVLEKIAAKENPQSLIGVFEQRWAALPVVDTDQARQSVWVALEEIRDPGNLGTIIRTADAAGVAGIILVGNTCDPYSREAVRASMGSVFAVPIARADHAGFVTTARSWPGDVVGTHLRGTRDYREANYDRPVLLVMGNEGAGLSDALSEVCNELVRIPMIGRLDSLNLAVATALMLFEIQRPILRSSRA
jgi:TrmH family RNA methyltransferase